MTIFLKNLKEKQQHNNPFRNRRRKRERGKEGVRQRERERKYVQHLLFLFVFSLLSVPFIKLKEVSLA